MNIMENSQPERTMSLMVDRPIPIPKTEYAYYIGELLPFNIAIYAWMYANDRYITSLDRLNKTYGPLNFKRKLGTLYMRRIELGFNRGTKTDQEIKEDLITVLES
jgi:hypothetical protein